MPQWREGRNTYLRIGVSVHLRDKKHTQKTGNNHWTPSENNDQHLKNVPAGSNALLRSRLFSKENTALTVLHANNNGVVVPYGKEGRIKC